jgi:hypothetical protein
MYPDSWTFEGKQAWHAGDGWVRARLPDTPDWRNGSGVMLCRSRWLSSPLLLRPPLVLTVPFPLPSRSRSRSSLVYVARPRHGTQIPQKRCALNAVRTSAWTDGRIFRIGWMGNLLVSVRVDICIDGGGNCVCILVTK